MKKTGEITDVQWYFNKKGMSPVEQLIYRPRYNVNTGSYDLFFNKRFKGWRVWQVAALIWGWKEEEKKKMAEDIKQLIKSKKDL